MAKIDPGILILGYARPQLLDAVLESLKRQQALSQAHVWIDGTADRMELRGRPAECADVVRKYPTAALQTHRGHLGIEKLMLDALSDMCRHYESIIILEDDCFPTRDAVRVFTDQLALIESRDEVFSIYGHPFMTATEEAAGTRFQGWGWATNRRKLTPVLQRARELFLLPEKSYLEFTQRMLTPEVIARLNTTPGRNVCQVLNRFFSWDSCTALLTALERKVHWKTPQRVIYNCGLGGDSGHFTDSDHLRLPPFNMIRPDEVWNYF